MTNSQPDPALPAWIDWAAAEVLRGGPQWETAADGMAQCACSADPDTVSEGLRGIFSGVIEKIADSFDSEGWQLYVAFFSRVIAVVRNLPAGRSINQCLIEYGLLNSEDIITRYRRVRIPRYVSRLAENHSVVVVLSRITTGADVAVTGVILNRLRQDFPALPLSLAGPSKSAALFAGDPAIQPLEVPYPRHGGLAERLSVWICLKNKLDALRKQHGAQRVFVIDPDSRMTQLGLLPVCPDEHYLLFESRCFSAGGGQALGELTNAWLQRVLGPGTAARPWLCPPAADFELGRQVRQTFGGDKRPLICINFGVGENHLKRIPGDFEFEAIRRIVKEGWGVILDQGSGTEESARTNGIIGQLTAAGVPVVRWADHDQSTPADCSPQVLTWNGSLTDLAALAAASDLYIGYDSAGQHLASAIGTPTITVFTGYTSPMMPVRWKPTGAGPSVLLPIGLEDRPLVETKKRLLQQILDEAKQILDSHGKLNRK